MATTGREVDSYAGYGRSDQKPFTIPDAADGSAVTPIDFERGYTFFIITCEDASNIPAATTLGYEVDYDGGGTMLTLLNPDTAAALATVDLPTSGDFAFLLTTALGAEQLRLILSNNASGGSVVFKVYGLDSVVLSGN